MLSVEHVTKNAAKSLPATTSASVEGTDRHSAGSQRAGKSTIIKCIAGLLRFQGQTRAGTTSPLRPKAYVPGDARGLTADLGGAPGFYGGLPLEDDGYSRQLLERLSCGTKDKLGRSCPRACSGCHLLRLAHRPQV